MSSFRVGGFAPFSASDFPDHLAAVVFAQGCPWRCVYCHNPQLQPNRAPGPIAWEDVLAVLDRRRGRLDAVVFSGGEPTQQPELAAAMEAVKAMGFRVGLHTAGIYPSRLEEVLPWVDWVGLDLKAPFSDYPKITRIPRSGTAVKESLELIMGRGINHELRCTWHPSLLPAAALVRLLDDLGALGASELVLQEYRSVGCAEPLPDPSSGSLRRLCDELSGYAAQFRLRAD